MTLYHYKNERSDRCQLVHDTLDGNYKLYIAENGKYNGVRTFAALSDATKAMTEFQKAQGGIWEVVE